MSTPYYSDDLVTLYHGDCRAIAEWLSADLLVCDPPYGRAWRQGRIKPSGIRASGFRTTESRPHYGIQGDQDTQIRDNILNTWGTRKAIVFGDLMLPPPIGTKQVCVYRKPPDSGNRGATAGRRRDVEAVYLIGTWPSGLGGASSIFETTARTVGNPSGLSARYGHPHAKPVDVMQQLLNLSPVGSVSDPTAGSGSTLIAAKLAGRTAIGVEIEECYCEIAARRLDQGVLPFGEAS